MGPVLASLSPPAVVAVYVGACLVPAILVQIVCRQRGTSRTRRVLAGVLTLTLRLVRSDDPAPRGVTGEPRLARHDRSPAVRRRTGDERGGLDGVRRPEPSSGLIVARAQALAFRVARHGLGERRDVPLAEASAVPVSDFARGAAVLALAARSSSVTREGYVRAVDAGELVVGFTLRGAFHAVAPDDVPLFGRALLSGDDAELAEQLGQQMQRVCAEHGIAATAALEEVAEAIRAALAGGAALTKDELHAVLREHVRPELMPWCKGCGSHHVAPMLWRYASAVAGMRADAERRFLLGGEPAAATDEPDPLRAARRFLRAYAPATAADLATWAGLAKPHARRLWQELEPELVRVDTDGFRGPVFALAEDADALSDPPSADGVRFLPERDPFLQHPNRAWLTPDPELRKRLHRPVAGPGALLVDGVLAGLWRARAKGKRLTIEVEPLTKLDPKALADEAARVATLRGAADHTLTLV